MKSGAEEREIQRETERYYLISESVLLKTGGVERERETEIYYYTYLRVVY
jgi:hypothetical protein